MKANFIWKWDSQWKIISKPQKCSGAPRRKCAELGENPTFRDAQNIHIILFCFFSFFKKKLNFQFFCLSDRFLSSSRKLVSVTVFSPNFFSPTAGWLIYELHLGIFFSLKKTVSKTLSSVFQTAFWVKKEFPNVTHKLISPPQAKKFSAKIRSLRQVFATKRKQSLRQENCLFIYKKKMER